MWRLLVVSTILSFIGVLLISVHAVKRSCPPDQVVVRYKDRTFEQQQNNPMLPTELYWHMFHKKKRF